jgi:hypothetical protein
VDEEGYAVIYVGRTSNLAKRLIGHHSIGNRQASGPVKYGLCDCGLCTDQRSAIEFIHEHGRIAWHEVPSPDNAANRDLIELSLIARYMPPFNVKAER